MTMISPEYCRLMARYNAWQNRQIEKALQGVPLERLIADQGAFFGSILGTLNHILWGDGIWMSRFDPSFPRPPGGIAESTGLCPTARVWEAERVALDGRISGWAAGLGAVQLGGDLTWHSGATGREMRRPLALSVVHMFNHQTHHRGQVHAMMTAAGFNAPVSDLFLMPDPEEE